MTYNELTAKAVDWIKNYFTDARKSKAVIGISGGKDSYVAAALLVRALGAENVIGVMMPNGIQKDINDSILVIEDLKITPLTVNISSAYEGLKKELGVLNVDADKNIPPRLRMTALYAVAANCGGLVVGTTNASEMLVGYGTKFGDLGCDLNPLGNLTKTQVVELGHAMGLIRHIVDKTPADGLGDATDEDALGVTYAAIDNYIKTGIAPQQDLKRIEYLIKASAHKKALVPMFKV